MTTPMDLADEPFVSLTTYRRSGEAVATPLWLVRLGDGAAFWTPRSTGKVKRLRNNPAVQLRPCGRRGQVSPDAPTVDGHATVSNDPADLRQVEAALKSKYGLQYRFVTALERLRPGSTERVVIKVDPIRT